MKRVKTLAVVLGILVIGLLAFSQRSPGFNLTQEPDLLRSIGSSLTLSTLTARSLKEQNLSLKGLSRFSFQDQTEPDEDPEEEPEEEPEEDED